MKKLLIFLIVAILVAQPTIGIQKENVWAKISGDNFSNWLNLSTYRYNIPSLVVARLPQTILAVWPEPHVASRASVAAPADQPAVRVAGRELLRPAEPQTRRARS